MYYTPETIGELIKKVRKSKGVTQTDLAAASGTGLRFIVDLERGKPTCELGKTLSVLQTCGIKLSLEPPAIDETPKRPTSRFLKRPQ